MNIVLISGGFDPLHSGHIEYIQKAKQLGSYLIVALNSDEWLTRKKGAPFMTFEERKIILEHIKDVDEVYEVDDSDGSVIDSIKYCLKKFPKSDIIFANGGDRTKTNIPEKQIQDSRLSFSFEVGGSNKRNSSSKILQEWKTPKTEREWGYYRILHSDGPETKVKELVVNPNQKLSLQRHQYRSEHWHVSNGTATIKFGKDLNSIETLVRTQHEECSIPAGCWHQLINDTDEELKIVEIQYGSLCIEEDIERKL